MPGGYFTKGDNTVGASAITALTLTADATTPRRAEIYEFQLSFDGTLENSSQRIRVARVTAVGTATAGNEVAFDPADAAASVAANFNHTAEPTYTANTNVYDQYLNAQAKDRWVAVPGFGLIVPATGNAGYGWELSRGSGSAFAGDGHVAASWQE